MYLKNINIINKSTNVFKDKNLFLICLAMAIFPEFVAVKRNSGSHFSVTYAVTVSVN